MVKPVPLDDKWKRTRQSLLRGQSPNFDKHCLWRQVINLGDGQATEVIRKH